MTVTTVSFSYSEKRSYRYNTIEVGASATANIEDDETASDVLERLKDGLKRQVVSDADEALLDLVKSIQESTTKSEGAS